MKTDEVVNGQGVFAGEGYQKTVAAVVAWLRRPTSWLIIGGGLAAIIVVSITTLFLITTRGRVSAKWLSNEALQVVDQPVRLAFDRQLGGVSPKITPAIAGTWQEKRRLFGIAELEFRPSRPFAAHTTYTVTFPTVKRVLFGGAAIPDVSFKTQKAPRVVASSLDNKALLAMDAPLTVRLGSRAGRLRDLVLKAEPALALRRHSSDDQTFSWQYDGLLAADTAYTLTLYDKAQKEELKRFTIKTAPAPAVASPIKEQAVTPSDELKLTFQEAIEAKNRPDIAVATAGRGSWKSDHEYVFQPDKLEPGKTYAYTIPKGLRTARGGILLDDLKKTFATNGHVRSAGVSPWRKTVDQAAQDVQFRFDQAIDRKSAEAHLRASSGTVQSISWQGNTMIARLVNMGFQRQVQVWLEPGVQPVFGLPSIERIATTFTTHSRTIKLPVPLYRQAYAQSCEAASLRMALAYRGVHDSDWNILQRFGYHPHPRDKGANTWDDPTSQFVGDVNGDQAAGTGWGVYAGPVARAAGQYGRGASVAYGANANFVAQQIHQGNPVIAWGVWRIGAKIDSWRTPTGRVVSGPIPMHVRLVIGVHGEPGDPLGFYVHDPIVGSLYWTRAQFVAMTAGAGPAAQLLAVH